jgi:CubicO group peptidase (beta-lactamase class C family)
MNRLLTSGCLFVVTTVAMISFTAPTAFGQEKTTAKVSSSPDPSVTARVDALFARWDKSDSPGCALGIVKDGQLIYERGYGMANLDYEIPLSTKSLINIASISKQFTAMSILLLAKQGKLSLDDEIQKYLPELPRYQSPITIRHLIHHTSGIRDANTLTRLAGMGHWDGVTDDDLLALLGRQKDLNYKPGEEWRYSNTGYFLLGLIVKRVSGESLREFAEEKIIKPLGMSHSQFVDDRTLVVKNRAIGYHAGSNGGFSVAITTVFSPAMMNVARVGGSGLYTSVEDLFLWDQNFYNNKLGGGKGLITEELSTDTLNNGKTTGYAFGLAVGDYKGLKRIHHGGDAGGFESQMDRFPEQNFSVICLCNEADIDPDGLANQVTDIFLADRFKKGVEKGAVAVTQAVPAIISIPEKELAALAGLYADPGSLRSIRLYMKDRKLMVAWSGEASPPATADHVLSPINQNRFLTGGRNEVEIVFLRPTSSGRMQVKVIIGGRTTTLEPAQSITPTSAQLAEFTGQYHSDELETAAYTLSVKDGSLVLQIRNGVTVATPEVAEFFSTLANNNNLYTWTSNASKSGLHVMKVTVRFTRNEQNAVTGFMLSTDALRNLRFNKL